MTGVGGHDDGANENDGGSAHDRDHDHDENDCDCDFSRILKVRRSRSGCCCNQECRSGLVQEYCIPSKGWLDMGTLLQLAGRGSKSVNDDAKGWTGRRTT